MLVIVFEFEINIFINVSYTERKCPSWSLWYVFWSLSPWSGKYLTHHYLLHCFANKFIITFMQIDKFALNQVLLLKSYKRSANYGVTSTLTSSRGNCIQYKHCLELTWTVSFFSDNHMSGAALVKSFNQFCSSYKIVPILTRESVITRISMYMRCICCYWMPEHFAFCLK